MSLLRAARFSWIIRPEFQLIRFSVFGVFMILVYQGLYRLTTAFGAEWVSRENGPVEGAQALFAFVAAICLFVASKWTPIGRTGMWASGAFVLYAAARECDQLFESYLFSDAYQWLVGLPLLVVGGIFFWKHRDQLIADATWLMKQPVAALFVMAGIYLASICQLLDRPMLWQIEGVGAESITPVKILIEELCELFAYAVLAFAGMESMVIASHLAWIAESTDVPLRLVSHDEQHHAA